MLDIRKQFDCEKYIRKLIPKEGLPYHDMTDVKVLELFQTLDHMEFKLHKEDIGALPIKYKNPIILTYINKYGVKIKIIVYADVIKMLEYRRKNNE